MPTRNLEQIFFFGKGKQTDINTPNLIANMWRLNKVNTAVSMPRATFEDDSAEVGKGHEYATQTFTTQWDVSGQIEKYATSQFLAWAFAFAFGKVTVSGEGPYTYVMTPINPNAGDGVELPYFTAVQQLQPTIPIQDIMMPGCAVEELALEMTYAPGRANHRATVSWVGSGKFTKPSGLTAPALLAENRLNFSAASVVTLNGINYLSTKDIISINWGWKNNIMLDAGFYPGSGFQTENDANSGQIRGRLEVGSRAPTFTFVARLRAGSAEFAALQARTIGPATITIPADANNSVSLVHPLVSFTALELGETNGFTDVRVTVTPLYDAANGLVSATVITPVGGICQ